MEKYPYLNVTKVQSITSTACKFFFHFNMPKLKMSKYSRVYLTAEPCVFMRN